MSAFQQVVVNMVDYFDNMLGQDRKKSVMQHEEMRDEKTAQEIKPQEQQNVEPISVSRQTMMAINEEQRKLIEEVLREYLA